jgi:ParB/RepB/Spo0J family partition protein
MNNQNFQFLEIPLIQLSPSSTNPRKYFSEVELESLALSIKEKGVLQPIIVRPDADGYEIVCGERRFRAAMKAGLETMVCRVQELTDDEVLDLQIIENLQRRDVSPLEEAAGFHNLMNGKKKLKVKDIAIRVGKSEVYVYNRLLLMNLSERSKSLLERDLITASHALELCKITPADQDAVLDNSFEWEYIEDDQPEVPEKIPTLRELKQYIKRHFKLVLSEAPFDTADKKLCPDAGACNSCTKRTGANMQLFEDITDKDCCMDKECYDKKIVAHVEAIKVATEKDLGKPVQLLCNQPYYVPDPLKENAVSIMRNNITILEDDDASIPEDKIRIGVVVDDTEDDKFGKVVRYYVETHDEDDQEDEDNDDTEDDQEDGKEYPTSTPNPWNERVKFLRNKYKDVSFKDDLELNDILQIHFTKNVLNKFLDNNEFDELLKAIVIKQITGNHNFYENVETIFFQKLQVQNQEEFEQKVKSMSHLQLMEMCVVMSMIDFTNILGIDLVDVEFLETNGADLDAIIQQYVMEKED